MSCLFKVTYITVLKLEVNCIYFFAGDLAKLREESVGLVITVCPSTSPHATIRLPLDGLW